MIFKNLTKQKLSKKILFFFIPFEGIKVRKSLFLLVLLAIMFAIRIGLGYLSIPIKVFGFSFSFAWLPIYIVGWFYGPVIGLFFGWFSDTINWLIHGSIWFWLYAIQEPIVGFVSGVFASFYHLTKDKKIIFQIIILELIIISFIIFIVVIILTQFNNIENNLFQDHKNFTNEKVFMILTILSISIFLIILIIQNIKIFKNQRQQLSINNYRKYLYISSMIIFNICLFSFLLGPITNIEYLKFLNGFVPNSYLKYGVMYYLIPRVLKESFKTPIYIVLCFYIIIAINYSFKNYLNNARNSW